MDKEPIILDDEDEAEDYPFDLGLDDETERLHQDWLDERVNRR